MYSNEKLIIAGDYYEHYVYDKNIQYAQESARIRHFGAKHLTEEKSDSHIYRTKKALRLLLQANSFAYTRTTGTPISPLFITFTFKENIRSLREANGVYSKFAKRLNYNVYNSKRSVLKYLTVPEFQARGAVHYHSIYFNLPYLPKIYDFINHTWGQGFTIIEKINTVNRVAYYVSKYFTKGARDDRLKGQKAYFCSKGLVQPVIHRNKSTILRLLSTSLKPTYSRSYQTQDFGTVKKTCYQLV